jgi:hypothetical protein
MARNAYYGITLFYTKCGKLIEIKARHPFSAIGSWAVKTGTRKQDLARPGMHRLVKDLNHLCSTLRQLEPATG